MRCENCRITRAPEDLIAFWCVHPAIRDQRCRRRRYVCRPTDAQASLCFRQAVGDSATHAIGTVA